VDWKSKSLTQLIDALYKEVQSQYTSMERAFTDRREFILASEFAHYRMNAHVYEEKTDQQTWLQLEKSWTVSLVSLSESWSRAHSLHTMDQGRTNPWQKYVFVKRCKKLSKISTWRIEGILHISYHRPVVANFVLTGLCNDNCHRNTTAKAHTFYAWRWDKSDLSYYYGCSRWIV